MNYVPDSAYLVCGSSTCDTCSNEEFSEIVDDFVNDTLRAKSFCSFGRTGGINKGIFDAEPDRKSKWGNVPQFNPRPLARIGIEWRR